MTSSALQPAGRGQRAMVRVDVTPPADSRRSRTPPLKGAHAQALTHETQGAEHNRRLDGLQADPVGEPAPIRQPVRDEW